MKDDFIYFTKSERRGLLVFFAAIIIIIIGAAFWTQQRDYIYDSSNSDIIAILEEEGIIEKIQNEQNLNTSTAPKAIDPNIASIEELKGIGLSSYAAKSLIGFRKYNTISNEEQLSQVYGMDSTIIAAVRPFIIYPAKPAVKIEPKNIKVKPTPPEQPIDPNIASVDELISAGFSKFSSDNITKMRAKGTRFENIKDLERVYGVDEETLSQVKKHLLFNPMIDTLTREADIPTALILPKAVSTEEFNPNHATHEELVAQGISSRVAHTIIKFRNGREVFQEADDLLKVYGMTPSLLDSLRARIAISPKIKSPDSTVMTPLAIIDLSTATAEELLEVNGIGKYFSKAIIKYRDELGGYYSVEQLVEVPAMKPEIYENIKDRFKITGKIKKFIPISLEFREALKHPYMDYETTQLLFNLSANDYQEKLDQLIKKGMVDSRLIPYLLAD